MDTLTQLLLALADDKLMLGHRNSDWTGLGPILEEDIAFSSIAQDEIAHASAIYQWLGEQTGANPDDLAFGRSVNEYRCAAIVELSDRFDWAMAIGRQFFCDHFDALRLQRLAGSSNQGLGALARRLRAEEQVHVEHVDGWIRWLGGGTTDSKERLQSALDELAPHAVTLAEAVEGQDELESSGVYPPLPGGDMFTVWTDALRAVTTGAGLTLTMPAAVPGETNGRHGRHLDCFGPMLDEMCEVYRIEPGVPW